MIQPIAKESADWRQLKSWLIAEIHKCQRQLEATDPTVPESAHHVTRGEIAAFRRLLRAVEPDKLLDASELEDEPLDKTTNY